MSVSSYADDDDGTNAGAIYVFKKDEGGTDNWGQIKKLTPGANSDYYALGEHSLDMNDNYIIAGTNDSYHKVYVFKNEGGSDNWGQVKVLTGSEVESHDKYGESGIAIEGDYIVVGAYEANHGTYSDRGKAYVYKIMNGKFLI